MELERSFLRKLELSESADNVLSGALDRFPPLIIDRCLQGAKSELINTLVAEFSSGGRPVDAETITMPRRIGHGPRPARISTTAARVLYRALVRSLETTLPEESRRPENWDRFSRFDEEHGKNYLVHADIAACYEYIDHGRLRTEILTQSMSLDSARSIGQLLGEIMGTNRGLPQMHWASDRLGDAYLDILVRYLGRHGIETVRYVDDIKAGADNWDGALRVVELAAEAARGLGLALSAEKTKILRRTTMDVQRASERSIFASYFQKALGEVQEDDDIFSLVGPYGELIQVDRQEPDQANDQELHQALMEAFWSLAMDWYAFEQAEDTLLEADRVKHRQLQQWLPSALGALSIHTKRLPDSLLGQWAFKDPSAIRPIVSYVLLRTDEPTLEHENPWASIEILMDKTRRSPWSLVWLLYGAGRLARKYPSDDRSRKVKNWSKDRMHDLYEIVRAEAAWTTACFGSMSSAELTRCYRDATSLTQSALAASMIKQGSSIGNSVRQAIRDDGPLNRKAIEWAEGF